VALPGVRKKQRKLAKLTRKKRTTAKQRETVGDLRTDIGSGRSSTKKGGKAKVDFNVGLQKSNARIRKRDRADAATKRAKSALKKRKR